MHLKRPGGTSFILLILFGQLAKAQTNYNPSSSTPVNTYLNNFVQPAPNAASLGKYADYPVGYFTGVPEISVPIYSLKDGGLSLPVSLSYHASGIHVSELASWVGLGWALNAAGVINRTVRGAPDEGSQKSGAAANLEPQGYYRDGGLFNLMPMPYPLPGTQQCSDQQGLYYSTVIPAVMNGSADTEPDLYTFNFNGHSGKFVFDEKGVPRLLEDDNIKITPHFSSSHFISWTITAEDGIQYIFGENNTTEMTRPHSNGNLEDADDFAPSSWYITHIINPNTKDTITFNYANEGYSYNDLGPESQYFGGENNINTEDPALCNNSSINGAYVSNLLSTTIQGLKLTSIVSKNYTIQFVANNVRTDLSTSINNSWKIGPNSYDGSKQYSKPCSLDTIKIYTNGDGLCIRQFALSHDYFTSTQTGTTGAVLGSLPGDLYDTNV